MPILAFLPYLVHFEKNSNKFLMPSLAIKSDVLATALTRLPLFRLS